MIDSADKKIAYRTFQRGLTKDGRFFVAALCHNDDYTNRCIHLFFEDNGEIGVNVIEEDDRGQISVMTPFETNGSYNNDNGWGRVGGTWPNIPNKLINNITVGVHTKADYSGYLEVDMTDALIDLDLEELRIVARDAKKLYALGMARSKIPAKHLTRGDNHFLVVQATTEAIEHFYGFPLEALTDGRISIARRLYKLVDYKVDLSAPDLNQGQNQVIYIVDAYDCGYESEGGYHRTVCAYVHETDANAHCERGNAFLADLARRYGNRIPSIANPYDKGYGGDMTNYSVIATSLYQGVKAHE